MAADIADGSLAAELSFRAAFEQSAVGMALVSPEGCFLRSNPALCWLLGRSEAELRGMTTAEVSHPENVAKDLPTMIRMLSGLTQSLEASCRVMRASGEVAWVAMNVSRIDGTTEDRTHFFVQVQDVTRTRRSGRRTRALGELRRRALAGMTVEVLMEASVAACKTALDMDCAVIYRPGVSGKLCLATHAGCPSEYLAEREAVTAADLAADISAEPEQLVAQGLTDGATAIINVRGEAHGVLAVFCSGVRRFSAADAEFIQAVADVLGRAIERRDHDQASERLHQQERMAAVGQLAAGAAHDFNNIISAVGLYAELLEAQKNLDGPGRTHLSAIRQQVERATALVWQILEFANRTPLVLFDVDLMAFLDDLRPVLRSMLPDDVEIRVLARARPCVVRGELARLQQIFLNLATNARDAFDGPGTLTITLSLNPPPCEVVAPEAGATVGWVRVDVADTGRGMPPGVLSRVFEPFFTTKPLSGGTGLGMAQVYGLVSQHGGHVVVDSSPSSGTTVSLWLRRGTSVSPVEGMATKPPVARGHGERLAVVDDDHAGRTALGEILESLGYEVSLAADGHEALSVLEREPTSFLGIVSDVTMPGMDGEELARIVTARWPELLVVLISGYPVTAPHGEPQHDPQAKAGGDHGRVVRMTKPFKSSELAATLHATLS